VSVWRFGSGSGDGAGTPAVALPPAWSRSPAIGQRRPEGVIHHSDQGDLNLSRNARSDRRLPAIATFLPVVLRRPVDSAQYTSLAFGKRCKEAGVRPSMGSVGDAYDNAMCESFFATLECELLERRRFTSKIEAKMACFSFIEGWYNPVRLHSALGYRSPMAYEAAREAVTTEA
jgi:putative transposase